MTKRQGWLLIALLASVASDYAIVREAWVGATVYALLTVACLIAFLAREEE